MMETKKEAADEELLRLQKEMEQIRFRYLYESAVRSVMEITRREAVGLENAFNREILSSLSGRIKTPESIERKLEKKGCKVNLETARTKLNDIAGVRAACFFLDDVYELAKRLKRQDGFRVLKEKNYIENPKASGYKSLHLIVEVPVPVPEEKAVKQGGSASEPVRVEVQLRTLAMDFWARLDHRLCYKKDVKAAKNVQKDLRKYAEIIARVDVQMLSLRNRIDAI
ncbi:MAG: GTP pyrophosphokinase [Lachnospiraceae bacterium]|nr:GTP pyrophosphokinase [Lachnospiraceae bacterium]